VTSQQQPPGRQYRQRSRPPGVDHREASDERDGSHGGHLDESGPFAERGALGFDPDETEKRARPSVVSETNRPLRLVVGDDSCVRESGRVVLIERDVDTPIQVVGDVLRIHSLQAEDDLACGIPKRHRAFVLDEQTDELPASPVAQECERGVPAECFGLHRPDLRNARGLLRARLRRRKPLTPPSVRTRGVDGVRA